MFIDYLFPVLCHAAPSDAETGREVEAARDRTEARLPVGDLDQKSARQQQTPQSFSV
jgi:hypothetical protein